MSAAAQHAFFIAGPTGCGKSAVAQALAKACGNGEIVNGDAFQVYRGLEVLTAAPATEDRARTPHHLFGILEPEEEFDVARYLERAVPRLEEIVRRGAKPLITGGSGMYLKALTHGLSPTPPGDLALRAALEPLSLEELVQWLDTLDPEGAAATNLKNRRYVTRALEICLLSGEKVSVLKSSWQTQPTGIRGVILERNREDLYERINRRSEKMLSGGAIEEVEAADHFSVTALKAIGVPEIRRLLQGKISQEECAAAIAQSTRHYAKRQSTWFRRERVFKTICLEPDETAESACRRILDLFPELAEPGPLP